MTKALDLSLSLNLGRTYPDKNISVNVAGCETACLTVFQKRASLRIRVKARTGKTTNVGLDRKERRSRQVRGVGWFR